MIGKTKFGDGGSKKGKGKTKMSIPYSSTGITKVPAPSPADQRNIPYASVVTPQQPAPAQPTSSGSGGTEGSQGSPGGGETGGNQSEGGSQ